MLVIYSLLWTAKILETFVKQMKLSHTSMIVAQKMCSMWQQKIFFYSLGQY